MKRRKPKRADRECQERRGRGFVPRLGASLGSIARALSVMMIALALGTGCTTTKPSGVVGPARPDPAQTLARTRASLQPALEALRAAMQDGEDEYALSILDGLRARTRGDADLTDVLDRFELILVGRRLVAALDIGLRVEPAGVGQIGEVPVRRFRLLLDVSHRRARPIVLSLPPGTLERLRVTIDALGSQSKDYQTRSLDLFEGLTIAPGESHAVELLTYDMPFGAAVAIRDQWDLDLLSGELEEDGTVYPAMRIGVRKAERSAIAPFFPTEPIGPEVLLEYVQGETVQAPLLVERAIRIEPERRVEALKLLAPLVETWESADPERLLAVAPALRWLAHRVEPGVAWADALRNLDTLTHPAGSDPKGSNLELGEPRTAPAAPRGKNLDLP